MSRFHGLKGYERSLRPATRGVLAASLVVIIVGSAAPAYAGLVINPIFGNTITSDPNAATIEGVINTAIQFYEKTFTDPITVNIQFDTMTGGLGQASTYFAVGPYSSYRAALVADATSADDATALAHLPGGPNNPVNGNANMAVSTANLRALGIDVNPPVGQPDSFIGLNTHITFPGSPGSSLTYYLPAVVEHEIDHALGFGSALDGLSNGSPPPTGAVWGMDLYRYDQNGNRSFDTNINTQAFFSIDGGATDLVRFNQTPPGDFSGWFSTGPHTPRVQDSYATRLATPSLGVELRVLDVLGYDLAAVPEPSAVSLLGTGMLVISGFGWWRRKRRAGQAVA